jgi:hypothetical protein
MCVSRVQDTDLTRIGHVSQRIVSDSLDTRHGGGQGRILLLRQGEILVGCLKFLGKKHSLMSNSCSKRNKLTFVFLLVFSLFDALVCLK